MGELGFISLVFLLIWSDSNFRNARSGVAPSIRAAYSEFGFVLCGLNETHHLLGGERSQ
jgi:hypothetical protein